MKPGAGCFLSVVRGSRLSTVKTMRDEIRLLLLQIRNPNDPMRDHEVDCFLSVSGLERGQIVPIDAVAEEFRGFDTSGYDGLLVGGSGEYSWARPTAKFLEPMKDFVAELVERDFPVFASCFGFHTITVALGGAIETDPENMEVGTFELTLCEAGRRDLLFDHLAGQFLVQMGHKDRVVEQPRGVEVLARGPVIDCQAFRVRGKRTWATQFHPELSESTNRERYLYYFQQYPGAEPDPTIMESFRPSQPSSHTVRRFIDEVLLAER